MTPSQRIEEIRKELISQAWVDYGGNQYSSDIWEAFLEWRNQDNPLNFMIRAFYKFLDEQAEKEGKV